MDFQYLDLFLVEKMCHPLAVALFDNEEDRIPPMKNVKAALLDSALNSPKQTFGGDLYPTLAEKAAILFYTMIQNHPFENGNKRIGTTAMLVFLFINGYWLKAGPAELADWALKIASSNEKGFKKERLMPELLMWLSAHIIKPVDAYESIL